MFDLPRELERPPVPPANPPTPKTTGQADQPDQPKKKRKPHKKAMSFLSEEEIERLFGVIASVRDRAIFQLAYRAGLRASEIGMLQLRDYDAKARQDLCAPAEGFELRPPPPDERGGSGPPRLAEGARILSRPDLPVKAEAAD